MTTVAQEATAIRSLPMPRLDHYTRESILDYFQNSWALTEVLFSGLKNDDAFYYVPYHQLRHPLIFYYAHPAVLYVNKLRLAGLLDKPINAYFEQLFEIGVDEMRWDDISKNTMQWPTVTEVKAYRQTVCNAIINLIKTYPDLDGALITMQHPLWALFMGFEHERIHLETSSVLMRELPLQLLVKPNAWPEYDELQATSLKPIVIKDYPLNELVEVKVQTVVIGKPADYPTYGWDNEYGSRVMHIDAFRASEYLISNGEFFEFVKSGGYQDPSVWSDEGWKWRTFRNIKHPTFWVPVGPAGLHQYDLRLIFEVVPMQWMLPVNVNYHEAKAYCAWRSKKDKTTLPYRLLTEAEHHALRDVNTTAENLNLAYGAETSVNKGAPSQAGFYDVFGNVWQWCEDHFAALPGFKAHAFYDDFSAPCFDGKHHVIMGGSFMSTGDEATPHARFHFRPHFFQHAGFRIVAPLAHETLLKTTCLDAPAPHIGVHPCCMSKNKMKQNKYESSQVLNQYLLLHYGSAIETCGFMPLTQEAYYFPQRCAELLIQFAKKYKVEMNRALDLGCAVGGSSFALSREFKEVLGIDLSEAFIAAANELKTNDIPYSSKIQGEAHADLIAHVDDEANAERVIFKVGDACALPADLPVFNVVLLANLLCRLPNPLQLFARLTGDERSVKSGGLLMITSPYSWLEEFTPKSAWLGGYEHGKTPIEVLHEILDSDYDLVHETNMPLVIREHARKFEYIIAHATIWRSK